MVEPTPDDSEFVRALFLNGSLLKPNEINTRTVAHKRTHVN
jgi:hypothetical protein